MIDYVTVIHGKNNSYNISKIAFYDLVNKAIAEVDGVFKFGKIEIKINESHSNTSVSVPVVIEETISIYKTINNLKKRINQYFWNILNSNPLNIQIIFKGRR